MPGLSDEFDDEADSLQCVERNNTPSFFYLESEVFSPEHRYFTTPQVVLDAVFGDSDPCVLSLPHTQYLYYVLRECLRACIRVHVAIALTRNPEAVVLQHMVAGCPFWE